jgi:hypothetical protein
MAFLARQVGFAHVGGIARGAQVSANSVRMVLRELELAGRLEEQPRGDMPGFTGPGYRLRPDNPGTGNSQSPCPPRHPEEEEADD